MPHIHTNPGEHDATASAFIVRFDTPEPQLLLHMHKKLHKLLQPGGHVELTENPWQAVLHELIEETGYDPSELQVLQPAGRLLAISGSILHPVAVCQSTHIFTAAADHYHSDTAYGFAASGLPSGLPADGESADLRWFSRSELAALPDEMIIPNVREIGCYVLDVCAVDWQKVPIAEFQSSAYKI